MQTVRSMVSTRTCICLVTSVSQTHRIRTKYMQQHTSLRDAGHDLGYQASSMLTAITD